LFGALSDEIANTTEDLEPIRRKGCDCNCHVKAYELVIMTQGHMRMVFFKRVKEKKKTIQFQFVLLSFIANHSFQTRTNRANVEHMKTINTAFARQTPQWKIWSLLFSSCLLFVKTQGLYSDRFVIIRISFLFVLFC